jgi:hypothetical protein
MDIHSPEAADILRLAAQQRRFKEEAIAHPNSFKRRDHREKLRFFNCGRKKQYTRAAAKFAAENIRHRLSERAEEYHCKTCGFWHVGNVQKGDR